MLFTYARIWKKCTLRLDHKTLNDKRPYLMIRPKPHIKLYCKQFILFNKMTSILYTERVEMVEGFCH